MSASEQDFSESSNLESPHPQDSPYSSPSQQVPHLVNALSGITCEDVTMQMDITKPYLRMIEQPQDHFRYRYKTELVGTHGCLLGKSHKFNKTRTHPTVELVNYTGQAVVRVMLWQVDRNEEHVHRLQDEEQEEQDVSTVVPQQGSYKVGFGGMGIIHTAKKHVPAVLFKRLMEKTKIANVKELKARSEQLAKTINLNIVRLRFSAHDISTGKEICPPVFSEPIHNMKSAATNDLRICRISRYFGRPRGGDDVFILVEKVNKKNILIRFFELDEDGEEVWSANGNFLQSDVHHQYAIVFRTPPFRDLQITKDVKVYIELVRPSDGRTSERKEFVYKAEQVFKHNKRRRVNSSYSSLDSLSGGSIKSMNEVPTPVEMLAKSDREDAIPIMTGYNINLPIIPVGANGAAGGAGGAGELGDALLYGAAGDLPSAATPVSPLLCSPQRQPMLSGAPPVQPSVPPVISLNSAEMERLVNHDPDLSGDDRRRLMEMDLTEYMQSFGDSLNDKFQMNSMDFLCSSMHLVTDSGGGKGIKKEPVSPSKSGLNQDRKQKTVNRTTEYSATYKIEDGNEVKKLVREICEIIKNKTGYKKQDVRNKLESLFEMRLSNGDTFLHMTLASNQPSLEYMIKLVHSMKMTHLLNYTNDLQQTILHLAIMYDMPRLLPFLISKGCDPSLADVEGNNAVHYAVVCGTCLKPLLEAIKHYDVPCDLNAYNNEKQTALHLAGVYNSEESVRLLCGGGADVTARDAGARTPLHLALTDDCHRAAVALIQHTPECDIDAVDGAGHTALQLVCAKQNICEEKLNIAKMLLDKKANPLKQEWSVSSAWRLSQAHPPLRALLVASLPAPAPGDPPALHWLDADVKSEPDDDFESADEGEQECVGVTGASVATGGSLPELSSYVLEVSRAVDGAGPAVWTALAGRLQASALVSWLAHCASPTATLLKHVKESSENMTSEDLAMILQELGQVDAANIIRQYIE